MLLNEGEKFTSPPFVLSHLTDVCVVQDLPDTIHIGGRISPNTVWDYVGKLKTSLSKVCLLNIKCSTLNFKGPAVLT